MTKTIQSVLVLLLFLGSSIRPCAQAVDVPSPLTYESALELALARNLDLESRYVKHAGHAYKQSIVRLPASEPTTSPIVPMRE